MKKILIIPIILLIATINISANVFISGHKVQRLSGINKFFNEEVYIYLSDHDYLGIMFKDVTGTQKIFLKSKDRNNLRNILSDYVKTHEIAKRNGHSIEKYFGKIRQKIYFSWLSKEYLPKKKTNIYFKGVSVGAENAFLILQFEEIISLKKNIKYKPNLLKIDLKECKEMIHYLSDDVFQEKYQIYLKKKQINSKYDNI